MDLTDIIYSNDYINILIQNYVAQSERYQMLFPESSALLTLNPQYSVLFLERSLLPENLFGAVPFTGLPKLFTPLSTLSLEVSGIVQTQNLYGGGYTGKNVIFGFLDTGIDYRHPAFLHANGQSRILAVWDQTDRTGTPPAQFPYGSLYTKSDLDAALESGDPLSLVPVTDPDGHGTYVAGVAGGTPDASAGFLGVAPEADFAVVKLKPAKQNLKDFYLVSSNAPVFEEDDLLSAMHFLNETAAAEGKPLVLCLALGTNQGSHSGTLPVSLTLARYGNTPGVIPVCATGNEGNASHHYYGSVSETYTPKNVEFLVSEGNRGFTLELWGQAPQLFSVGFRSPGGETIPRIPVSLNQEQRITFVLERTVIYVNYEVVQATTGSQLILIRMLDPTPGIWTLQVYRAFPSPPDFHIWLPITGFSTSDVTFLEPDPYTTLTTPSATVPVLSPSTYQAANNSFSPESGRGFTRLGEIKPDFAAPGVSVTGPGPAGSYVSFSGSSASAAITSGAAALFLQWGIQRTPARYFTAQEVKNYLIRGADRTDTITYPSREWGYGRLQLYQSFTSLMTNCFSRSQVCFYGISVC